MYHGHNYTNIIAREKFKDHSYNISFLLLYDYWLVVSIQQ